MSQDDEEVPRGTPPPQVPGIDAEVGKKCLDILERFRRSELSKEDAIAEIFNLIPNTIDGTKAKAVASYTRILDNFERRAQEAEELGRADGRANQEGELDAPKEEEATGGPSKRPADNYADDDAYEERTPKRRLNLALLPWVVREALDSRDRSPLVQRTRRLLELYGVDIKAAKASLLLSLDVPPFPDDQWDLLLRGRAGNLDTIFGDMFSTETDKREAVQVGGFELSSGQPVKPAQTVKNHGQWTIAIKRLKAASIIVMPHLAEVWDSYIEYITGFFAALPERSHHCVILFDKAVRRLVGSRRDILLTDYSEFQVLMLQWITTAGAAAAIAP